jgi:hypothetical protein
MFKRIPQPPLVAAQRASEHHEFWPGLVAAVLGVMLAVVGGRHMTGVDTTEGGTAWETQLMKAFASGGLQYANRLPPPPPPRMDQSPGSLQALERWERQNARAEAPSWKIRVDIGAKAACPT